MAEAEVGTLFPMPEIERASGDLFPPPEPREPEPPHEPAPPRGCRSSTRARAVRRPMRVSAAVFRDYPGPSGTKGSAPMDK